MTRWLRDSATAGLLCCFAGCVGSENAPSDPRSYDGDRYIVESSTAGASAGGTSSSDGLGGANTTAPDSGGGGMSAQLGGNGGTSSGGVNNAVGGSGSNMGGTGSGGTGSGGSLPVIEPSSMCTSAVAGCIIDVSINVEATYLATTSSGLGNGISADAIDLSACSWTAGTTLVIRTTGDFYTGGYSYQDPYDTDAATGLFSSSAVIDEACLGDMVPHADCANFLRVPGAISAGTAFDTGFVGLTGSDMDTDIPEDFLISDGIGKNCVEVTLPAASSYLFVSPFIDPSRTENSDWDDNVANNFRVVIQAVE